MEPVLHSSLPFAPWLDPAAWRLPGMQPLEGAGWLLRDDAFAGQMALRDRLLTDKRQDVLAVMPEAGDAAAECLSRVLDALARDPGYTIGETTILRPDGVTVPLDRTDPLLTIGRLIQEDVCLLLPGPEGHVLAGAALCFPASWTLAEKIGRALPGVHRPVKQYDESLTRRVQRMFDTIRPEQPLWRSNALLYDRPDLHAPRREDEGARHVSGGGRYLRSERQTLSRLPETGAVVFTIHTFVVPVDRLSDDQRSTLDAVRERQAG